MLFCTGGSSVARKISNGILLEPLKHRIPVDSLFSVGLLLGSLGIIATQNGDICEPAGLMAWDRLGEGSIGPMSHGSLRIGRVFSSRHIA